jgi:hypothetical protein
MISENIDRNFFKTDLPLEERIVAEDKSVERRPLGTLTLIERWLSARYRTADGEDVSYEVLEPFREVRSLRQPQAHALGDDKYNPAFTSQQDDLLGRATRSLTQLRLILSSHPHAKEHTAPEWLDCDKIVFY